MPMTQIYSFEPSNTVSEEYILYNSFLIKFKPETRLGGIVQLLKTRLATKNIKFKTETRLGGMVQAMVLVLGR